MAVSLPEGEGRVMRVVQQMAGRGAGRSSKRASREQSYTRDPVERNDVGEGKGAGKKEKNDRGEGVRAGVTLRRNKGTPGNPCRGGWGDKHVGKQTRGRRWQLEGQGRGETACRGKWGRSYFLSAATFSVENSTMRMRVPCEDRKPVRRT